MLKKVSRPGEWHDYRIRAEGPRVRLWVNGVQTVDYTETEPGLPATGVVHVLRPFATLHPKAAVGDRDQFAAR